MAKVHTVFCYIPLYWLVTADVAVVFIKPGLNRVTSLSSINIMPGNSRPAGVSGRPTILKSGQHCAVVVGNILDYWGEWLLLCGYLPVVLF
jgi:hypothetical protein